MQPVAVPTRPTICTSGLRVLQESLDIRRSSVSSFCDAVLIATDFEDTTNFINHLRDSQSSQAGSSILDTRDLYDAKPINIRLCDRIVILHPKLFEEIPIRQTFSYTDGRSAKTNRGSHSIPTGRNVILIGHGVQVELKISDHLGVRSDQIVEVIDTFRVARKVLGFWARSFAQLWGAVGCPFSHSHCGGNDAHFTLKAALGLAIRELTIVDIGEDIGGDGREKENANDIKTVTRLDTSRALFATPTPCRVAPNVKAAWEREKRGQRSPKHQLKHWSKEQQDKVRAERAVKRIRKGMSGLWVINICRTRSYNFKAQDQ